MAAAPARAQLTKIALCPNAFFFFSFFCVSFDLRQAAKKSGTGAYQWDAGLAMRSGRRVRGQIKEGRVEVKGQGARYAVFDRGTGVLEV